MISFLKKKYRKNPKTYLFLNQISRNNQSQIRILCYDIVHHLTTLPYNFYVRYNSCSTKTTVPLTFSLHCKYFGLPVLKTNLKITDSVKYLTLYHTISSFNDPEKEDL